MRLPKNSIAVITVPTFMFTANGIVICLKASYTTLSHWLIVVPGMALTGFIFGSLVVLLVVLFQYLRAQVSLRLKWYKQLRHQ